MDETVTTEDMRWFMFEFEKQWAIMHGSKEYNICLRLAGAGILNLTGYDTIQITEKGETILKFKEL